MRILSGRLDAAEVAEALDTESAQPLISTLSRTSATGPAGSSPKATLNTLTSMGRSVSLRRDVRTLSGKPRTQELTAAADSLRGNPIVSDILAIKELVTSNWINLLLVCVPLGMAAGYLGWDPVPVFLLNFLALVPLAMVLGDITEDLALRLGPVAGGLLNASFGNVTEVVLSLAALRQGLLTVVAESLLGSILSNLLLVLGCCFLVGGVFNKLQTFNATGNRACSSMLFLSCIGIAIPTSAASIIKDADARDDWVLAMSRGAALVLLACYVCYLVFTLGTHKELFAEEEGEEGEEAEVPVLTVTGALLTLTAISVLVAIHSEFLTGAIEATSQQTGISTGFLAVIVLPIAGNACEHITAVLVAAKNKMDLALGIAIGSSLQIALFAIPLCVLVGWAMGQDLSLNYDTFSVIALVLSVVHANLVTADAQSHWLMGVQLCAVYILIALVFWYR
ncbi:CAX family of cation antiporter, membrane protein [Haematococcus lacustris]